MKLWGCEVFPKDFKMIAERKLMGSLIQRLETVEVIEFMKEEKKAAFLLTQDLASSSKGPISSHLSAVSPLKDLYIIIHPSDNHLHNDH